MQELFNAIISSNQVPYLTSFLLGVLVFICPCTLATNFTIILFILKKEDYRQILLDSLLFIIGKMLAYIILGIFLIKYIDYLNISKSIQNFIGYIIGPILIFLGLLFIGLIHIHGLDDICVRLIKKSTIQDTNWGYLFLGMILAFAFCPYSATLYFGAMLPLTLIVKNSWLIPIVFSIGTSVLIIPLLIFIIYRKRFSENDQNKIQKISAYFQHIIGIFLLITGGLFCYEYYFE